MPFDLKASRVLLERMVLQDIQVRKEIVAKVAFQVAKVRFSSMCFVLYQKHIHKLFLSEHESCIFSFFSFGVKFI